jgi:hypothetical protein
VEELEHLTISAKEHRLLAKTLIEERAQRRNQSQELVEVLDDSTISPKEYHRQQRLAKNEIEDLEESTR